MIANPYTPVANREQKRAAKYLVGWMLHEYGKVLPPERVDAIAFAKWMLSPKHIAVQRYSVLWLTSPHLANIYKEIAQSRSPISSQDLWTARPSKNRMLHDRALAKLRSSYTHWVKCEDGRYWATIDGLSTETVATYCGWLGTLWTSLAPELPNPWWEAREACAQQTLAENQSRWGKPQIMASQAAMAWLARPTLLSARDAWLLCGVALLGLRASEIASAVRSDLHVLEGGQLYVNIRSRRPADRVIVGPAAAAWLHRFEGSAKRDSSERSEAMLEQGAPLWPSMSRWGAYRGPLEPLRADSVHAALREMSMVPSDPETSLTMLALRSLLEASFARSKRDLSELMGRSRQRTIPTHELDQARLLAQARAADEIGLSKFDSLDDDQV